MTNIFNDIKSELERSKQYPMFNSYHEGYAVLLEEVDELWDEVKSWKNNYPEHIMGHVKNQIDIELVQIAAMAIKMLQYNRGIEP